VAQLRNSANVTALLFCLATSGLMQPARAAAPVPAPPPPPVALALVIGNSHYASLPPIPSCDSSARLLAAALGRAGFTVTAKYDATNGEMGGALASLEDAARQAPGARVLAYVCGYAVDFDGRTFLLPVSAAVESPSDVLAEGLVAKPILDAIARTQPSAGLVLFDDVTKPGSPPATALDAGLTALHRSGAGSPGLGAMAARATGSQPQGATPLSGGVAAALAPPVVELGALMTAVAHDMAGSPGVTLVQAAPSAPGLLVGAPPKPAPPPPVAPPPTPAPPPAPAPAPAPASAPMPAPAPVAAPAPPPAAPPPAAPAPAAAAPAAPPPIPTDPVVLTRAIQLALKNLGYYAAAVDGIVGPEEQAAIRRYQHEMHAPMTGQLTPAEISRLLVIGR
jgi:hypothetical protein